MKSALIIGGGFAGCAMAHQFALLGGWDVTLVERGGELGAGVRTRWYGGHPYTYGPRHFLTQNENVWNYLDAIVPLRRCAEHEFLTYVEADGQFYSYPINTADIPRMPDRSEITEDLVRRPSTIDCPRNLEEYWIASVGPTLYRKFISIYTEKMWRMPCPDIDTFDWSPKGVTLKEGPRAAWDTALSGYPIAPDGYNRYFNVATAATRVVLNASVGIVDIDRRRVRITQHNAREFPYSVQPYDLIVCTISPDDLFGELDECCGFGPLPFLGRDVQLVVLPVEQVLPDNVYFTYYAGDEPHTRVTEYKKFTRQGLPGQTLISIERVSDRGKFYPLPVRAEMQRAARYHAALPDGYYCIGRAATYRYGVDMDDCIEQAMQVSTEIEQGGREHPVPLAKWRKIG